MKLEDIKTSEVSVAIHCTTKELYMKVLERFEALGITWTSGKIATKGSWYYTKSNEETCLMVRLVKGEHKLGYGSRRDMGVKKYKIISDVEFLESNRSILDIRNENRGAKG